MTEHRATITSDPFRILGTAEAMALPAATIAKVYAEFRLLTFDVPNENRDGFRAADVTDAAVATLVGAPIYVAGDMTGHPQAASESRERARYQIGTVVKAEKQTDGIYAIAAFARDWFGALGVNPRDLPSVGAVSMECTYSRTSSRYQVGDKVLTYREARDAGIASAIGQPDNRQNYDVRWLQPIEYNAVALLRRGFNADKGANFLQAAAALAAEVNVDVEDGDVW